MTFDFKGDVASLLPGIREFCSEYHFCLGEGGLSVEVVREPKSPIRVAMSGQKANITYDEKIHFFRALGLLLEQLADGKTEFSITEKPQFTMNGPMFDVSQGNAVLNKKSMKNILRRMALMGLNMLMMYCEDSYDVKKQPYFGYMRARYSEEELRECDEYAGLFGIEMIPCIQTLAHLIDVLKWKEFSGIKEDYETLLVGCDKTYQFIEDLIRSAVKPFKTKKIHIGMDEAWHLGLGTYLSLHGLVPSGEIMKEHLARVMEIVRRLGLEPMMWSDMFFKAYAEGDYYDKNVRIPESAKSMVPNDATLVYWDYYHFDEEFYSDFIDKHRVFGEPVFAGGIWTWTGFAANWGMTFKTTNPALMACKKKGIKRVMVTIWGDNGTECNAFANLLGLSLFAEHGYSFDLDEEKFKKRFEFCTGAKFDDFYNMKYLDEVPGSNAENLDQFNPSKYLMWQDILTGLFDKNIDGLPLDSHYAVLAKKFEAAAGNNGDYNDLFRFNYHVADVLSVKSELGLRITRAYKSGNRAELKEYVEAVLPGLVQKVRNLRKCHMRNWFSMYKTLGWDVMDMRYGSLLIRIESAIEEITAYLNGQMDKLEELEEERLYYNSTRGLIAYANYYGKIVSPSRIAPEA